MMNTYLEGLSGEFAGQRLPLSVGEFRIGRSSRCDLVLSDARVSRQHVTLVVSQGQYLLRDEDSRAGTLLNNTRVKSAYLQPGDVIEIRGNVFRFSQEAPPPPPPAYHAYGEPDTGPAAAQRKSGGGVAIGLIALGAIVVCGLAYFALSSGSLQFPGQSTDEDRGEYVEEKPQEEYAEGDIEGEQWHPVPTTAGDPSFGSIAEPYPESLPTSPVPAGTPVYFDGWSMMVSSEIEVGYGDRWGISVVVENMGEKMRVFRFQNAGVTAQDNLGNVYPPANLYSYEGCEAYYHKVKNLEIDPGKMVWIKSFYVGYDDCDSTDGLHSFRGPIPLNARQMIIHFESFGPFSGVDYVIDL